MNEWMNEWMNIHRKCLRDYGQLTELREEQWLKTGGEVVGWGVCRSQKMEGLITDDINFELYQECNRGGFWQMRDISRFNITCEINVVL